MPVSPSDLTPGTAVNYTGTISGYAANPGTVQPSMGDGVIRILWDDGFALTVLLPDPGTPMMSDLALA
jgi:hypothetical protein